MCGGGGGGGGVLAERQVPNQITIFARIKNSSSFEHDFFVMVDLEIKHSDMELLVVSLS